ncbi:PilZ domain-containing protein, partial [Filibacter tadaridae]
AYDIPLGGEPVKLHIKFTLQSVPIDVQGTIKWKKPSKNGQLYGFDFEKDAALEQLIVDELKLRRHAEIEDGK